jgi:hypothetical protein
MGAPQNPTKGQLDMAAELGIDATGMNFLDLKEAIHAAPPTDAQRQFIAVLFEERGWTVPATMTFSQASRILDELAPLTDEQVLMDNRWGVGDILQWRDGYYRITRVALNFKVTLERVELIATPPGEDAVVENTKELRHPFTLSSEEAKKVDLSTVQPE